MSDPGSAPAQGLELRVGDLRLALRPDLGGSVAGLWLGTTPVLRSTVATALEGPRASACFPLVPYSNRLGYGRFVWRGHEHAVRANFDGSPHPLHGVGWRRAWEVTRLADGDATLRYRHRPDADWPFAFEAEQRLTLDHSSARFELQLLNTDQAEQPAGVGWHPYVPRRAGSRIRADVQRRWDNDGAMLPFRVVPQAGLDGVVDGMEYDNCFDGLRGTVRFEDELLVVTLATNLQRIVVFTPPGLPHFCVEPVSHVNDAIHAADPVERGVVALAPGQALRAWMRLEIVAKA